MWQDEILDEIHKFREEHAKSFNYDLDAMFVDWQKRQAESGRQVVSLPPKQGLTLSLATDCATHRPGERN
ncbi:MAG: hypothetical protein GPJ15_25340 [Microcystis aeruginosa G11-06]|jgi:hypothetical protein|nr:hypothetical protein [Microcystis aeruginosa G11-06]NCS50722.1 hypothetical protein [Microcystis aeruginosa BK11-02]NCS79630.1 hypothetical protein [Microcystis aeruginosa K13-07]